MNDTKIFNPDKLGTPLGLYSHVAIAGETAYIAGQVGIDGSGTLAGADIEAQLRQTMSNLAAALEAAGSSLDRVVKFTTYLIDAADIDAFMAARKKLFPEFFSTTDYPPNTLLVVDRLVKPELKIEIEAIASRAR